ANITTRVDDAAATDLRGLGDKRAWVNQRGEPLTWERGLLWPIIFRHDEGRRIPLEGVRQLKHWKADQLLAQLVPIGGDESHEIPGLLYPVNPSNNVGHLDGVRVGAENQQVRHAQSCSFPQIFAYRAAHGPASIAYWFQE